MRFKRLLSLFIIAFMFAGLSIPAQACTAIYAGSEMTELRDRTQETVYTEWEGVQEEVLHAGDHASETATQGIIAITEQVFQSVSLLAGKSDR